MIKQICAHKIKTTTVFALLTVTSAYGTAHANTKHRHSTAITGFLGLNTVPSARMDETGTIRIGVSTLDPYTHGFIGVQIAEPLHISFRQTAEISNITEDPKQLLPGIDLKLRLLEESAYTPEISLGMQSAIGHKRMAGEYIALSKRYNNFDFTAGLGWGRFGSAGHLDNPLAKISNHFDKNRTPDSDAPNTINDWFTGDQIGVFAGIEYFLPYDGLSLKLDYGADQYKAEQDKFNYKSPSPFGFGLSYNHDNWASASIGLQGTDKVMGRISLQSIPSHWSLGKKAYNKPKPFYKSRKSQTNTTAIKNSALNDSIVLKNIIENKHSISADIEMSPHISSPQQIGRAIRHIAENSGKNVEEISITPNHHNLIGKTVKIIRSDVEKYMDKKISSPEEIWANTEFVVKDNKTNKAEWFLPTLGIKKKTTFTLALENQISLSEEDRGILYRSSAIIDAHTPSHFKGISVGSALRLNIANNLSNRTYINKTRPDTLTKDLASNIISLDKAYIEYTKSLSPSWHILANVGYLEERYAGIGGEIIYRPPSSRLALGADLWSISPRQSNTMLNIGLGTGQNSITGHINGWYDLPRHDLTINARAGRFIAGDTGLSVGLEKIFKNGAKITGSTSLSNYSDTDIYGGETHAYHNINLTLPIGYIPKTSIAGKVKTKIAPFDRVTGQTLTPPNNLFNMTEMFTIDHMANNWAKIVE
ncbi:MAG: YjbH domain-containing protein [Alphaproteobacteria bacterium]